MIRVFLLLLACMAGTWYLIDTIKQNGPGYVLISYNDYTLETSFWFSILLMATLVALVYATIRLSIVLFSYSIKLGLLPETLSRKRAIKLANKGTQAFLDQHWSKAGSHLIKAAKNSTTPFLDQIMAARAYLAGANFSEAEKCLQQARKLPVGDPTSLSLLELDISIARKDTSKADRLLQALLDSSTNPIPVLSRAITHYTNSNNWEALNLLLPKIRKKEVLNEEAFLQLQARVVIGLMQSPTNHLTLSQLNSLWNSAEKVQDNVAVVKCYCAALLAAGEVNQVEKCIKKQLQKNWSDELITLYGTLKTANPARQLTFAETFTTTHKNSAALQLTLARLAMANELIGQAREHLEHSLKMKPTVAAHQLMADIYEQLNDPNSAKRHLKLGLKLALSALG